MTYSEESGLESSMASTDALNTERMARYLRALYLAKYTKNDNMPCEIEQGLFLGSVGAAYNKAVLNSLNITHILMVANALEPAYPNDFKYKHVEVLDSVDTNLEQHFEECFSFIDEAKREGAGVLVHCFAGRSRSATIVVAYLMRTYHMSLSQALELVRSKRPQATPNPGFLLQLQNFENHLGGYKYRASLILKSILEIFYCERIMASCLFGGSLSPQKEFIKLLNILSVIHNVMK